MTEEEIRGAFSRLADANARVAATGSEVTDAKRKLAKREYELILQGVDGKNAEERKARLDQATISEQLELALREEAHVQACALRDLAANEVKCIDFLLRLLATRTESPDTTEPE